MKGKRKMKFVHIADMHFDSPFTGLNDVGNLGDIRRLEQRKVFKKVIDYVKQNQIEYLLIAGDLYEHEYIRKSSIEYINNLFQEIENTKILISPGNHDPYIKGSYYQDFQWSKNVQICKNPWEIVEGEKIDIYMTAFTDFYENQSIIEKIQIKNPSKINLLLTHCDLNGNQDENGFSYQPILESKLNTLGFDYVAMGHIHKTNFTPNKKIVYPGSTISFGFDEIGEHGMIVGELNGKSLLTNFIKLDDRLFTKYELNVDNFFCKEDLVEKINNLKLDTINLYEIILTGNRQFEINTREILNLIEQENILKIKDNTRNCL